ncbi:MAG: PilZ domain-containing protein [Candidatus Omnitrophica bacterium]|nr:PilZ domain-containing protein [Candidatus Omnitrophota bacterium]
MSEKRKHVRYELAYDLAYSLPGALDEEIRTESINISMGGICMKIRGFLKDVNGITLHIYDPERASCIKAKGRLVWQSGSPGFGASRAGIRFTEVPWTQLKTLLARAA